jgi:hypothetical protein
VIRSLLLLVSSWGGHKLSSCFLRPSICWAFSVSLCSSVSTTTLPSPSKMRKWSTLFTATTMIRSLPSVGIALTSFSEDINRRSNPLQSLRTTSGMGGSAARRPSPSVTPPSTSKPLSSTVTRLRPGQSLGRLLSGWTGKPRVIHLNDTALAIIEAQMDVHPSGHLFRNTRDKPWTYYAVDSATSAAKKRA